MKRQSKIRAAIKLSVFIILLCMMLSGCAEKKEKLPTATYMGGNNTITEICKELHAVGASHVDVFQEWVTDFADSAGKNAMRGRDDLECAPRAGNTPSGSLRSPAPPRGRLCVAPETLPPPPKAVPLGKVASP